jgi:hypothetical protein
MEFPSARPKGVVTMTAEASPPNCLPGDILVAVTLALAAGIVEHYPDDEMHQYRSTGPEATLFALRPARWTTSRAKTYRNQALRCGATVDKLSIIYTI